MKTHLIGFAALVAFCGALAFAPATLAQTATGSGSLTGTATGSATKADGTTPDVGANAYAMRYDGPVEFTYDYTVNMSDKLLEPTGSTITFTTVYFSWKRGGKVVKVFKGDAGWTDFTTQPIQITGATFGAKNQVLTIDFAGPWYPIKDAKKYGLIDTGLTGSIDFTTGKAKFTSSYQAGAGGAISTYVTAGTVKPGVPEPATWAMLLVGVGMVGALARTSLKRRVSATAA